MKHILLCLFSLLAIHAFPQQGSEILLFNLTVSGGEVSIADGKNITNHPGYDNQPYFHPRKSLIYYTSFNDSGRSDIKVYNVQNGSTNNLTKTDLREYSPTVTPDGEYISCIIQTDKGAQDIGKYPIEGGEAQVLINDLVVGYHAWIDNNQLLLFVLGDSNIHTLRHYDLWKNENRILATNIGRSLHKIPGRNTMSFVQLRKDTTSIICEYNPVSGSILPLVESLPGSDHLCWLNNDVILMSSSTGLYYNNLNTREKWRPVKVSGSLVPTGVTRVAVSSDNSKIAVVVAEDIK